MQKQAANVVGGFMEDILGKGVSTWQRSEKLDALKAECGWIRSKTVKSDMRFGDWVEFWFEHYCKPKLRPTTQANYESRIRHHIVPELGHIRLDKLTQADLQKFYNKLKTEGRVR